MPSGASRRWRTKLRKVNPDTRSTTAMPTEVADVGVAIRRAGGGCKVSRRVDPLRDLERRGRPRQTQVACDLPHVVRGIGRVVRIPAAVVHQILYGDLVAARVHRSAEAEQRITRRVGASRRVPFGVIAS